MENEADGGISDHSSPFNRKLIYRVYREAYPSLEQLLIERYGNEGPELRAKATTQRGTDLYIAALTNETKWSPN